MADGRIVFQMDVDNSAMQKDLNDAKKQIDKATKDVEKQETAKLPLVEESKKLSVALDEAKRKLHELNEEKKRVDQGLTSTDPATYLDAYAQKDSVSDQAIKQQEKEVADLQKRWEKVEDKIDACNRKIQDGNAIIDTQTTRAGKLSAKLAEGGVQMSEATEKASKKTSDLGKRLMSLARSALVFSVITAGLTAMRNYMGKALKTNDEFTGQLAKLKAAMLTAFQPIYEFVVPALITLMRILTAVFQVIARLFSFFGRKSTKQNADAAKSLYEEADAINAIGGAAKAAKKELAGFDEITTIGDNSTGGGGSAGVTSTMPNFEGLEITDEQLDNILHKVALIGAGLLSWKIGSAFGLSLVGTSAVFVGLLVLFATVANHGEELFAGLTEICQGFIDFLAGIFAGDLNMTLQGVSKIFGGLKIVVGAVISGAQDVLFGFLEWLDRITGGRFTGIINSVKNAFKGLFEFVSDILNGLFDGTEQALGGLITFISGVFTGDWKKAWNGILSIINGVLTAGTAGINGLIRLLNKISFTVPDWVPGFGGAKFGFNLKTFTAPQIPYLAQGAVIPPNKPFMAMLGDQRHGTNIEAPLSTIQEAVAIVMEDHIQAMMAGFEALLEENRELRRTVEEIEVGDEVIAKAANRYNARLAIMRGDI